MAKSANTSTKIIQSVDRALEILDCFDENETELSLAAICNRLLLNKSTALGIINTLIKRKYLDKNLNTGHYRLGSAFIGKHAMMVTAHGNQLIKVGNVHIRRLSIKYSIDTFLYGYMNNVLYLADRVTPDNANLPHIQITAYRMAMHAAASGKLILSQYNDMQLAHFFATSELTPFTNRTNTDKSLVMKDLLEIKERGYAIERDEMDIGVSAFAVPIMDGSGILRATISGAGGTDTMDHIEESLICDLKKSAREIADAVFAW